MDKSGRPSYSYAMLGRIAVFLAILSFAVVTAMTAAHETRMTLDDSMTGHADHMISVADAGAPDCGAQQSCDADDGANCVAVCAGVSIAAAPVAAVPFAQQSTARPDLAAETILHGQNPNLNERPPQSRLL